jgi:NADPH:quinone reductase-like Zn-dependent oxidoreductase
MLTLVEAPTPTPTEGTLLVEIRAAGVNYADIMARSGFYPRVPKAPFSLGFEIAGVVKGIGKDVEGFKEGDSIAAITQGRENPKESRMRYFC